MSRTDPVRRASSHAAHSAWRRDVLSYAVEALAIATVYYLAARLGFLLAIPPGNVTIVWPPSGFALAVALLIGVRAGAGIWLGAFAINLWFFASKGLPWSAGATTAAAIAVGSTLQAWAGAWFIRRLVAPNALPRSVGRVARFVGVEAACCVIAATIGVGSLCVGGLVPWSRYAATWSTWWLGDLSGVLVVAPLLVVLRHRGRRALTLAHAGFPLICLGVGISVVAFFVVRGLEEQVAAGRTFQPWLILVGGLLITALFASYVRVRLRAEDALEGERGELERRVHLRTAELERANVELQAEVAERHRAEEELRLVRDDLEARVAQRTDELTRANEQLRFELMERERAERELLASERRFRSVAQSTTDAIIIADAQGRICSWNQGARETFGHEAEEALHLPMEALVSERSREAYRRAIERLMPSGDATLPGRTVELLGVRSDGTEFPLELSISTWKEGPEIFVSGIVRDVTERRELEEQLRQSQKMEAVGRLAGGVAHDFNNLLTVIMSCSDLLLLETPESDVRRMEVEEIRKAGDRAAALTRQLLAFSRKQVLAPVPVELNALVEGVQRLVSRLVGEDIEVVTILDPSVGKVMADPGQVEQVILNLVVNARDAMPKGGKLTLQTGPPAAGSHHVMLAVGDTGCGMDEATLARVFEPFFTTKDLGKGTGLGLATVYGIVKQSGGHLEVTSQPGQGTTFRIYLPWSEAEVMGTDSRRAAVVTPRAAETILLVEDDASVRGLTKRVLEAGRYSVLEARDPVEALAICNSYDGQIQLMLTDVIMPHMSGRDLADRIASLRPATRVLFMSGYTDEALGPHGVLEPGVAFLQKPFTPATLTRKVREVIERAA